MIRQNRAGSYSQPGFGVTLFSREDLEALHQGTLEVLANTGLQVESAEALQLFAGAGAQADMDKKIVRIPAHLVEEAIRIAPPSFTLAARNPQYDYQLGGQRVGYCTFGIGSNINDPFTGERRPTTKQDVADIGRLHNALEQYTVCDDCISPLDIDSRVACLHQYDAFVRHCEKHILQTPDNAATARYSIEMAAAVAGGMEQLKARPIVSAALCAVSPLVLPLAATECIVEYAKAGLPIILISMALAGGTSPVTLAGTIIVHNAEILGGLVLTQAVNPGNPFVYASVSTIMDMRTGNVASGAVEEGMLSVAFNKLAQYYRLPTFISGAWTDSKVSDMQAAQEKTLSTVLNALSGTNLIQGMACLDSGMVFDYAQLLADHEMCRMVNRVLAGIPLDDVQMALDIIHKVGPANTFLYDAHTRQNMRNSQFWPELHDRNNSDNWRLTGARDMRQLCLEKARQLLETVEEKPLGAGINQKLDEILARAEKELCVKEK